MKALFDRTPWGKRLIALRRSVEQIERRLDEVNDRMEARLDGVEEALRTTQAELADLRETRVAPSEARLDEAERALASVTSETTRLRDDVVPAMVGRSDALLERLAAEIDEVGSLLERRLRGEPLPVPAKESSDESGLAAALAEIQPALLEVFRGSEAEISHRLEIYLEVLSGHEPVLDLGCGRGELLLMLREAGVAAAGIEGDAAVAAAARRRGLDVNEGDVLTVLRTEADASRGAVTAIHLFEHLDAAALAAVLAEIRRVLEPGGVLIAECPNPHSLRVGAALFWIDPTHRRPLMPETLELFLEGAGFEVERRETLHPFPAEQLFDAHATPETEAIARRLDELVNGPRDFAVWARKPRDTT